MMPCAGKRFPSPSFGLANWSCEVHQSARDHFMLLWAQCVPDFSSREPTAISPCQFDLPTPPVMERKADVRDQIDGAARPRPSFDYHAAKEAEDCYNGTGQ